MLNIDSEEEGIFLVSCAGGLTSHVTFNLEYEELYGVVMEVSVTNLKGGHSGVEIIKQRGNAVKLLGRVLNRLNEEIGIRLVTIRGGSKHNAISREAYATIAFLEQDTLKVSKIIKEMDSIFKIEYNVEDPNVKVEIKKALGDRMLLLNCSNNIIKYILTVPDGSSENE